MGTTSKGSQNLQNQQSLRFRNHLLGFLLLLTILLGVGCNKPLQGRPDPAVKNELDKTTSLIYPHTADFKTNHGISFSKSPKACAQCHGVDFSGGTALRSCKDCHDYPHPAGWALPNRHGENFRSLGEKKKACFLCHPGFDKDNKIVYLDRDGKPKDRPGSPTPQCQSCHLAFPHISDLADSHQKESSIAGKSEGKCLICHKGRMDAPFPSNKDFNCNMCHGGAILGIKWRDARPKEVPPDGIIDPPPHAKNNMKNSNRSVAGEKKKK